MQKYSWKKFSISVSHFESFPQDTITILNHRGHAIPPTCAADLVKDTRFSYRPIPYIIGYHERHIYNGIKRLQVL